MTGNILVTGAAGMIGSAVVWALNQRGRSRIIAVDRLGTSSKWKNLLPLAIQDYWEAGELLKRVEEDRLPEISTVFHLGACSATTEQNGTYLMENNFAYTKALAEWAVRKGVRFVYASSAATYGARETGLRESIPLHHLRPLNRYGYSKHLFDVHAESSGLLSHIVGLKYFNVFGPNENHKGSMRSMVFQAFHQIQETGQVKLFRSYREEYPDGGQQRDFLYVKDAVQATLHLAEVKASGLFNIGSGHAHTWVELAKAVFAAMGREPNLAFVEMPDSIRHQYQYFTCADLTKLKATGYAYQGTTLEEAVRDYVQNYLTPDKHLGEEVYH